jgi:hypothetical protein
VTTEERLERIERLLEEALGRGGLVDPNRAYNDAEVRALLGGISRSTLWRIRRAGLLATVDLCDDGRGGKLPRTLGRQIIAYLSGRERAADVLNFTSTGRKRDAA